MANIVRWSSFINNLGGATAATIQAFRNMGFSREQIVISDTQPPEIDQPRIWLQPNADGTYTPFISPGV